MGQVPVGNGPPLGPLSQVFVQAATVRQSGLPAPGMVFPRDLSDEGRVFKIVTNWDAFMGATQKFALAWIAAVTVVGCDVGGLFGTDMGDELADARARWDSHLVETYEIDFHRSSCECVPESTIPVRVRVKAGTVESGVQLPDSTQLPIEQLGHYLTVEQLFASIQEAIEGDPYLFEAEYDPNYGFPTSVSWDRDRDIADDEIAFSMGNLNIITTYPSNPSPATQ